jgi:glycosyltransferase involved in cell wall biosynthesis
LKISIIVPAFNEEKLITQTLLNLELVTAPFLKLNWQTELIVCDNNSTDGTATLARQVGAMVVFEPFNQISLARNRGAAAASGEWLLFVDADSSPSVELMADVAEEIQSGRCIGGGSTVKLDEHRPIANLLAEVWNRLSLTAKWMAGSFIFCEAAAFREAGGFSNELFVSEEIEFSKRLKVLARKRGRNVVVLSRHPLRTSARKMHLYSWREHFRFVVRNLMTLGRGVKIRDACFPWYDGRR